jgi:hypothetical protein
MEAKRRGRVRWIALGMLCGLGAAWGGFGAIGAVTSAPSAITTCTKASTGKSKVIAGDAASTGKCTKKGKGFVKSWTDARYREFLRGTQECSIFGTTDDFRRIDFTNLFVPRAICGGNFTGANFAGAWLQFVAGQDANFTNVNFTNATFADSDFTGAITTGANTSGAFWGNVICPNGENSDAHGSTCVGQGF